jgi:hypothetical protein
MLIVTKAFVDAGSSGFGLGKAVSKVNQISWVTRLVWGCSWDEHPVDRDGEGIEVYDARVVDSGFRIARSEQ